MTLPARQVGRSTERLLHVLDGELNPAAVEAEYAMDRWQADRLGIDAMRGRSIASFEKTPNLGCARQPRSGADGGWLPVSPSARSQRSLWPWAASPSSSWPPSPTPPAGR